MKIDPKIHRILQAGTVIPAHPLALTADRKVDEERQRALTRYYLDAGVGGLAVGVHTTQFAIHNSEVGLYRPVLELAAEEIRQFEADHEKPIVRVGGICGTTKQAVAEAEILSDVGYHAGLLNLGAMKNASIDELVQHCRAVADVIPVFGFYLHEAAGGCRLPYEFWRQFAEIENVGAIKIAAFNRYQTIDVIRAIAESGRDDIALYTGNDDNIVLDLLTPHRFNVNGEEVTRRFVGGLLGHWAVWTRKAIELHARCRELVESNADIPADMLRLAIEVTDMNAVLFDAANGFAGCIPGINEVLRRQGLLPGNWCLDENEVLSDGQANEITRIIDAYPHLVDGD